jgi:hypothetical protein
MPLQELALELPNRPGALAGIARILAQERINVAAISVDSNARRGHVRLVLSDPKRARTLLADAGFRVEIHELIAIRLEDRTGSFLQVLDALARAQVNIQSVAILVVREGGKSLVGISSDDLAKARQALRKGGFLSETAERLVSNRDLLATAPSIPQESVGLLL